jgi:nitrite reductase/ring-hydroxylating ferredoxin subunit/uncharacterized membrane protein
MAINPTILPTPDDLTPAQKTTLDEWSNQLQHLLNTVVDRGGPTTLHLKNLLNGTWLGHPLHPALTDVPIGAWCTGALLDLVGSEDAADAAHLIGVLGAVPTAMAGVADRSNLSDEPRRTGLIHALLNSVGLGLMVGSLVARRRSTHRGLGILLSTAGLSCAAVSAWLGGRLVYVLGTGVSRTAFEEPVADFTVVATESSVRPGELVGAEIDRDGQKIPIVLFKQGGEITAISATCTHVGGNLAEGTLVDGDCVECPWHGSRFSLVDGSVRQGPAIVPAWRFEVRIRNGNVEVRRPG